MQFFSYIAKDLFNGIYVLKIWISIEINFKKFDRRLLACFVVRASFFGYVHQSYISSDSTRLRDIPNTLSFQVENGYRIWVPNKETVLLAYDNILPQQLKNYIEKSLN